MERSGAAFNFSLAPGDRWGVLGTSGSGKTRFLRTLARLVAPLDGRLFWDEVEVTARPRRLWHRYRGFVAVVLDDPYTALEPWSAVRKYIQRGGLAQPVAEERLQEVGLSPVVAAYRIRALSGLARVRLALACALLGAPGVLLVDDVFASLAPEAWDALLTTLAAVVGAERALVIASTHATALRTMHEVLVMWQGRPLEWGPRAAVFSQPRHPYTRWILDQGGRARSPGVPPASLFAVHDFEHGPTEVAPGHWVWE
jgi:ABC-type glutathione transport system ATPase component